MSPNKSGQAIQIWWEDRRITSNTVMERVGQAVYGEHGEQPKN